MAMETLKGSIIQHWHPSVITPWHVNIIMSMTNKLICAEGQLTVERSRLIAVTLCCGGILGMSCCTAWSVTPLGFSLHRWTIRSSKSTASTASCFITTSATAMLEFWGWVAALCCQLCNRWRIKPDEDWGERCCNVFGQQRRLVSFCFKIYAALWPLSQQTICQLLSGLY